MTVFLGLVAASLVVGITATFLVANRDDEVVGFTLPHDLQTAQRAASIAPPTGPLAGIAPQPKIQQTFDDVIAELEAETAHTMSLANFYPGNLGVGTTLTYRDVDSVIFGVISFDFDGVVWQDYLAEHTEGQWWRFGVEPDQGMKLAAFETRCLGVDPGPDVITYEGDTYRVTDSGHANYRSAGHDPADGSDRAIRYRTVCLLRLRGRRPSHLELRTVRRRPLDHIDRPPCRSQAVRVSNFLVDPA